MDAWEVVQSSQGGYGWRCQKQQGAPQALRSHSTCRWLGFGELGGHVCQRASLLDVVTDKRNQKKAGIKEGQTKYWVF